MPKMLADGDDLLLWIPDGGIADIHEPTVAELTAVGVLDISCLVTVADFSLGSTGDETIDEQALCARGASPAPGRTNYEAGMNFYRWTENDEDVAWSTFTGKGIAGYLAHRIGKPHESDPVLTDEFAIYSAVTATPTKIQRDAAGGYRKFRQMFMVQAELVDERAIVSAA